ncbi:type II toxin-antitoxin system VapC family toxin [Streptomyces sp. NBC_01237]|uniref:type II toxin-antitoxin system VapC family toxin n=1 Tax=Streptomyces sp. NBC_01237 TaxID=2903790 RepID=UPI002DDC6768|nr:PIN domain-containing protein [Streptomyces sp. NBC_01237]WRZ73851.1 PIN domain-containing protein [Streptomyces sp. NBC_01237]
MSGTWVLDSEALSLYLRADREMTAFLAVAAKRDVRVIISAVTLVEADPSGAHRARMSWALSRLVVEPVTKETAARAVEILRNAGGLAGHKYAIDAVVAATALHASGPVTVLTSDTEDMHMLCGPAVAVVKV